MNYTVIVVLALAILFQFASAKAAIKHSARHPNSALQHHTKASNDDSVRSIIDDINELVQDGLRIIDHQIEINATISTDPIVKLLNETLNEISCITKELSQLPENVLNEFKDLVAVLRDGVRALVNQIEPLLKAIQTGVQNTLAIGLKAGLALLSSLENAIKILAKLISNVWGIPIKLIIQPVKLALTTVISFFRDVVTEIGNVVRISIDVNNSSRHHFRKHHHTKAVSTVSPRDILNNINNTIQDGLNLLDQTIEVNITISTSPIAKLINATLLEFQSIVQELGELPDQALEKLQGLIQELQKQVQAFVNKIGPLLKAIQDGVVGGIETSLEASLQVLRALRTAITNLVKTLETTGGRITNILLAPIRATLNSALKAVGQLVKDIDKLIDPSTGVDIIHGIIRIIDNGLQLLNRTISVNATISSEPIVIIIKAVLNEMASIAQGLLRLPLMIIVILQPLLQGFRSVITAFVGLLKSIYRNIGKGVSDVITDGLNILRTMLQGLSSALRNALYVAVNLGRLVISLPIRVLQTAFRGVIGFIRQILRIFHVSVEVSR